MGMWPLMRQRGTFMTPAKNAAVAYIADTAEQILEKQSDNVIHLGEALAGKVIRGEFGSFPALGSKEFKARCKELDNRSLAYRFVKRAFDLLFSLAVVVIGLIPGLILSIAVALDTKGSPIYSQERVGRNGRVFRIYKFRSMVADSDDVRKYFTPEQLEVWKRERKVEDDPRVTKLGRVLRGLSLDELPQFVNVLLGQIPLRILKMRQVFSEEKLGVFALPATEVRTNRAAFMQVNRDYRYCLHALQKTSTNFISLCVNSREFFAKAECEAGCATGDKGFVSARKAISVASAVVIFDGRCYFACEVAA